MFAKTPKEVHTLFLEAFNSANVEALLALYEPNAILSIAQGNAVGHGAIRDAYQQILSEGGHMQMETRTVLESGDGLAILHGAWTLHRNNTAITGLSTEVVRQQPDGTWLFILDEPRTSETS